MVGVLLTMNEPEQECSPPDGFYTTAYKEAIMSDQSISAQIVCKELPNEEWRPVIGYEQSYAVSSFGRVKRTGLLTRGVEFLSNLVSGQHGYLVVKLCRDGRHKTLYVHRIVLEAFVGGCPDGMEGCHNDGNRQNAKLTNLRWDTRAANQADRIKHGTSSIGKSRPSLKQLSPEQISTIVELAKAGAETKEIHEKTNVSRAHIRRIVGGNYKFRTLLPKPTHCPKGHEYTEATFSFRKSGPKAGQRRCLECAREYNQRRAK